MWFGTRLFCLTWFLLFSACSRSQAPVQLMPDGEIDAEAYDDILKAWTRDHKVYSGLDSKLFVDATYHAPDFRRAFAVAFPDIYGLGGEITRRELVDLTGDVEQFHTFFLSAYTPKRKWNDFNKEESIWRVTLLAEKDDGSLLEAQSHSITEVKVDENLREVYNHINHFDKAYLVRFGLTDGLGHTLLDPQTKNFGLRIASALGVAELRWDLEHR